MPNRVAAQHKPSSAPIDHQYLSTRDWWSKVAIRSEDECWLWTQSIASHGYGQTWDGVTVRLAHRVAWELIHGPIPEGMTIDHICRVRRCCNPRHLRILTNVANASDNANARKTHCPKGHPYDPANTYIAPKTGHRACRTCTQERPPANPKPSSALPDRATRILLAVIADPESTQRAVAEKLGYSIDSVGHWVAVLREEGLIHPGRRLVAAVRVKD